MANYSNTISEEFLLSMKESMNALQPFVDTINIYQLDTIKPIAENLNKSLTPIFSDKFIAQIRKIESYYLNENLDQLSISINEMLKNNQPFLEEYKKLFNVVSKVSDKTCSDEEIIRQSKEIRPMDYPAIYSDEMLKEFISTFDTAQNEQNEEQNQSEDMKTSTPVNVSFKQISASPLTKFVITMVISDLYSRILDIGLESISLEQLSNIIDQLISFLTHIFNL